MSAAPVIPDGTKIQIAGTGGNWPVPHLNPVTAIAELEQANQQDPRNLYRLSQAYQAKRDTARAQDYCKKAAEFNSLPQMNYAFIRAQARKMAAGKKA